MALCSLGAGWGQGYPEFWLLRMWGARGDGGVPWGVPELWLWGYGVHRAGAEWVPPGVRLGAPASAASELGFLPTLLETLGWAQECQVLFGRAGAVRTQGIPSHVVLEPGNVSRRYHREALE